MSFFKQFFSVLGVVLAVLFWGCSTDFDLTAEKKETMVIYGLLEPTDTVHYVKITRAFLDPQRNAYDIAKEKDSLYYEDLSVRMEEIVNGSVVKTITFQETLDSSKEPGTFHNPDQIIYKANASLNEDAAYRLVAKNNKTGYIATAETPLVKTTNFKLYSPASSVALSENNNIVTKVKWQAAVNGKVYHVIMRMKYVEISGTDTSEMEPLEMLLTSSKKSIGTDGLEDLTTSLSRSQVFNYLVNNIPAPSSLQIKRKFTGIEFVISVGGEELSTYIDVSKAQIGLVQTQAKPEYTNVENGLGIFSSRLTKTFGNRIFTAPVLDDIACDPETKHLRFVKSDGTITCL